MVDLPTFGKPTMPMDSDILEKIKIWTWRIVTLFLVVAIILATFTQDWFTVIMTSLVLILIYVPVYSEKRYKINFPSELEILFIFFIYASLYLGEVQYFYDSFWWWDLFLHGLSGIIIGLFGFLLVFFLHQRTSVIKKLNLMFISLFAFCFAVSLGGVW